MKYLDEYTQALIQEYNNYVSKPSHTQEERASYINSCFNKLSVINKIICYSIDGVAAEEQVAIPTPSILVNNTAKATTPQVATPVVEETAKEVETPVVETVVDKEEPMKTEENVTEEVVERKQTNTEKLANLLKENGAESKELTEEEKAEKEAKIAEQEAFLDKYENATAEEIMQEQFKAWKLKLNRNGCKFLLKLGDAVQAAASNGDLLCKYSAEDQIIDYLAKVNNTTTAKVSDAITSLINKADFTNSLFIPILAKLDKKSITNYVLLRELIEFYEPDNLVDMIDVSKDENK